MEIVWYGHSCFRISDRGQASVVSDPYDSNVVGYEPLKLKGDIVTISHDSPSHNYQKAVKGSPYIINGPGEYEIGGVFITGIRTDLRAKRENGSWVNTMYLIEYNGINIAHMGDMFMVPTQAEVEDISPVHIALVPVGNGGGLSAAQSAEVISLFEPNIVIPMHYATNASKATLEPISKFLKVMGLSEITTQESFKIGKLPELPEDTQVIILDYAGKQ